MKNIMPVICPCCHSAIINLKGENIYTTEHITTFECIGCEIIFDIRQELVRYCSKCGKEGTTGSYMCDPCREKFLNEIGFDKDALHKAFIEINEQDKR